MAKIYIGTAGWNVPSVYAAQFAVDGTHLQRYAQRLNCAEINSCFHREHKPETYRKWASSVVDDFRFSVKAPRAVTHEGQLLGGTRPILERFLEQSAALGPKREAVLLQTPPRLAFDMASAGEFFSMFRELFDGPAALEPRHLSWFEADAELMLQRFRISRVAADPTMSSVAARPGGWPELQYYRLHGSPRRYYSSYSAEFIDQLATAIRQTTAATVWCVFDNTASGAALGNALELAAKLR